MGYKPKTEAARQYAEKLKDPRWRARRLEILERDGHACRGCGAHDPLPPEPEEDGYVEEDLDPPEPVRLEVHHKYYEWGKDPWDYPNNALITLCEMCHDTETAYQKEAAQKFLRVVQTRFLSKDIFKLTHAFERMSIPFRDSAKAARLLTWALTEPRIMHSLAHAYENRNTEPKPTSAFIDDLMETLQDYMHG